MFHDTRPNTLVGGMVGAEAASSGCLGGSMWSHLPGEIWYIYIIYGSFLEIQPTFFVWFLYNIYIYTQTLDWHVGFRTTMAHLAWVIGVILRWLKFVMGTFRR